MRGEPNESRQAPSRSCRPASRRRLGFLQPALWTRVRSTAWRPNPLNLVASAHALFIALNGMARRRQAPALRTRWATFRTMCLDLLPARPELRSGWALSRPVLALNLFMVGLSVFFSIRVGHALFTRDLQSPSRIARPLAVTALRSHDVVPNSRSRAVYEVIATRTLFHPNRSEPTRSEAITTTLPPAPTLALYGVVISGDTYLAYIQDLATKQVLGYRTGAKLAGGQVERIEPDRVVIMRADGPIEVMLHRPKEPLPVVPSPEEASPRRSRGRQE